MIFLGIVSNMYYPSRYMICCGDALAVLKTVESESVQCCITSPPYFGLRDYGVAGQLGLERTPDEYVANMVAVFREVRRVLKDDGVLWLNLGDSYANDAKWGGSSGGKHAAPLHGATGIGRGKTTTGLKAKDLIGIPWRVAFALQAAGWVLRQEIVWSKPNPMPESVGDRCTKSHEQIFMFAKAKWSGPAPGRFAHISDADARWLALLVDAEGCIVVKRVKHAGRGDTFAPQVSIGNTSEALMQEVSRIVGHGSLLERPGKNCRMLYWQLSSGVATDFLKRIYPFLIVKQRQARIGIYVDSLTYYRGGQKKERKERNASELSVLDSLWARNKQCNRFGQPDLSDVPEPVFGRWADCERYYYNAEAIKELGVYAGPNGPQKSPHAQGFGRRTPEQEAARQDKQRGHGRRHAGFNDRWDAMERAEQTGVMRNKRSVWNIATRPFSEAHFATFPEEIPLTCILAGSRPGDVVLDPFNGAGTVGVVCVKTGREYIGIELSPTYCEMSRRRIASVAPLFSTDPVLQSVPAEQVSFLGDSGLVLQGEVSASIPAQASSSSSPTRSALRRTESCDGPQEVSVPALASPPEREGSLL